jgi:hypothetical protein
MEHVPVILMLLFFGYLGLQWLLEYPKRKEQHARWKADEEERKKKKQQEEEEQRRENDRKDALRKLDKEVDRIIRKVIIAHLELEAISVSASVDNAIINSLKGWREKNASVMDFQVFSDLSLIIDSQSNEKIKEAINGLPEHDSLDMWEESLWYADEKLELARRVAEIDKIENGMWIGGPGYEQPDGSFELPHVRYRKILYHLRSDERPEYLNKNTGYIYILTNESLPGLIKIGCTSKVPEVRASRLSRSTGIPTPFSVAFKLLVNDFRKMERKIHKKLERHRVADNREFFKMSVEEAATVIRSVAGIKD